MCAFRCNPVSVCKDASAAFPRLVDVRRASPIDLWQGILRVNKRRPPASAPGLGDILGIGSEVPSEGTSLFLMAAQLCGYGSHAEKNVLESLGRIRLGPVPQMSFKRLQSPGVDSSDCTLGNFRVVAKETDNDMARALAKEREASCDSVRMQFAAYAPAAKSAPAHRMSPAEVSPRQPEGRTRYYYDVGSPLEVIPSRRRFSPTERSARLVLLGRCLVSQRMPRGWREATCASVTRVLGAR